MPSSSPSSSASSSASRLPKFGGRKATATSAASSASASSALQNLDDAGDEEVLDNPRSSAAAAEKKLLLQQQQQRMEEDAWSKVSSDYGFATKPRFANFSYCDFLAELRRYEVRWSIASPSRTAVYLLDVLKTGREDNEKETSLLSYCTDTAESHSMSDMLRWTEATLQDLHTNGPGAMRRSRKFIPFSVPKPKGGGGAGGAASVQAGGGLPTATSADERALEARLTQCTNWSFARQADADLLNADDDRPRRDSRIAAIGGGGASSYTVDIPGMNFLCLEASFHHTALASDIYNKDARHSLYQLATVTLSEMPKTAAAAASSDSSSSSSAPKQRDIIKSVSMQTWVHLTLQSMLHFLMRNDIGIPTHEIVSTLHAVKHLQPLWHELRKLAGMHEAQWPIDLQLLGYPGKRRF